VLALRYTGAGSSSIRSFLAARVARIFPLQWAILFGLLLLEGVAAMRRGRWDTESYTIQGFFFQAVLAHAWPWMGTLPTWNVPSWSLSVEWLVYLTMAPLLLLSALSARVKKAAAGRGGLLVVIALVACHTWVVSQGLGGWHGVWRGVLGFATGVLLRRMQEHRGTGHAWPGRNFSGMLLLGAFCASGYLDWPKALLIPLCPLVVLASVDTRAHGLTWLESKPMRWLGERSYALYLLHLPVLIHVVERMGLKKRMADSGTAVALMMILVIVTLILVGAHILHHVVEKPSRKGLRKLLGGESKAATNISAART
jgi:peptidoglycan/LPS O-acetylase OafA/YrhL